MGGLKKRVIGGAGGGGKATGAPLRIVESPDTVSEPMKRNAALLEAFPANLRACGVVEAPEIKDRLGSSDVGNVSHVIPAIQPLMKIAPDGTPIHSRAFAAAARSPLAREGTLTASKAMAMTTLDLLADTSLVRKAHAEFKAST